MRRSILGLGLVSVLAVGMIGLSIPPAFALVIQEYPTNTPAAGPQQIALGPDGNLWFTESSVNMIGRINSSGVAADFSLPAGYTDPGGIAAGPDGNMWFTDRGASGAIGRFNPSTPSSITEFTDPAIGDPMGITAGPDGNIWFTDTGTGSVGRILTASPHTVKEYPQPWSSGVDAFGRLVVGPDQRLWYLGHTEWVVQFDPVTHKFKRYGAAFNPAVITHFYDITPGPDGNMWFTKFVHTAQGDAGSVVKLDTNLNFVGGGAPPGARPQAIAAGPDGRVWTWDFAGNAILQLDSSLNVLTTSPVPTASPEVQYLAAGPDGNMWFTEYSPSQIGRVLLPHLNLQYISYIPNRFFIPNITRLGHQGDTVDWFVQAPSLPGITDTSGMGLFGSGVVPAGQIYSFRFIAAGTYAYGDGAAAAASVTTAASRAKGRGSVKVPIVVQLVPGTTNQAQVLWSSADPPPGFGFDVQVRQPGSSTFVDWRVGVAASTGVFGPSDPLYTGPGTYAFRSRMRNLGNGAASGYSTSKSIGLT